MKVHIILIVVLIISLFSLEFLYSSLHLIPRYVTWIPEILSLLTFIVVIFKVIIKKEINIESKYLFLFFFLILIITISVLYNKVNAGPLIQGIRRYFKVIPFLLLPIVYPLNKKELNLIYILILIFCCIQLPFSLWQRFILSKNLVTGDLITGTLGHGASGFLSIILTTAIGFITSFYINKKMSLLFYIIVLTICIIPCSINETKVTFLFLPIAILFPIFFSQQKLNKIIPIVIIFILTVSSFFVIKHIYDKFITQKWGYGIHGFIQDEDHFKRYLSGRLNPLLLTLQKGFTDIEVFSFGKGIGNASMGFTEMLSGKSDVIEQADKYGIGKLGFNTLVWEIGLLATLLYFVFHIFIFIDSYKLSKLKIEISTTALGMIPFITIYSITYVYNTAFFFNLLNYLFFYFSGIIIFNKYNKSNVL